MKWLVTPVYYLFVALFPIAGFSAAKAPYGMAGCGLGSVIMGPKNAQVLASTTNQTSYQSVSILSGTSNCVTNSKSVALEAQKEFFTENFATLSKEIAQGDGDSVKALSDTFGCSQEAYPQFAKQLQSSYSEIFASPGALAALSVAQEELTENEDVVMSCQYL